MTFSLSVLQLLQDAFNDWYLFSVHWEDTDVADVAEKRSEIQLWKFAIGSYALLDFLKLCKVD